MAEEIVYTFGLPRRNLNPKSVTFRQFPSDEVAGLIQHLIDSEILFSAGVLLSIGDEGEKRFGRRHFLELLMGSVHTSVHT